MKCVVFSAAVLALASFASAQSWQTIQSPSAREIAQVWNDPPPEYGPEPYYGLNGKVTLEQVRRDLDTIHGLGFQAITVQAGRNMPFSYLSPAYFDFFRKLVEEVKQRNMRLWIVDDAGYPSGFAGGRFSSSWPQLRMQALEIAWQISVPGGMLLHKSFPPNVVSVAAFAQDGTAIPLPLERHSIAWKAPAGKWTVIAVDHEFRTSPTRSDTNPRRVKDTSQSLEDYLNPAATEQFLLSTHEQYKRYVGDEFGKTILGFRGDEPDYSIRGLPWTTDFFARFQQLKGYDVRPYAAIFVPDPPNAQPTAKPFQAGHPTDMPVRLTPRQLRIRADYYDVFSRMFAEGFFAPQGRWCARNHLEYQVHLNHEEMEMDLAHSEGSFFRDMKFVQVPGIDAIWHQIWTDTISDYPRLAGSVAHVYGKPRAFTESFAAYRPVPDVAMARYILNEQFVRGVNLVEMMYFPATSSGPRPPPSFMAEPGFPDLAAYVRRMSYLMAMGRPAASVGLFLPTSSFWLGDRAADTQFVSAERLLSEHQIDFDIVSEDAIAHDLRAGKGTLQTLSGNRYRRIILPAPEILSATALRRLRIFARGGGKVLFLGNTPQWIAGRTIRDARAATAKDFAWALVEEQELPPTPTPPAYPPESAPLPQSVSPAVLAALFKAASPTVQLDRPDAALKVMKRRWLDADVYLLLNESAHTIAHRLTLDRTTGVIEIWNGETGRITPANMRSSGNRSTLDLSLKAYGTEIVVAHRE